MTNLLMMNKDEMKQNDNFKGIQIKNYNVSTERHPEKTQAHIMMAEVNHDEFVRRFGSKVIISKLPCTESFDESGYYGTYWSGDDVSDMSDGMSYDGTYYIESMIELCESTPELSDLKSFLESSIEICFTKNNH